MRQTQLIDELLDISRIVGGRAVLDLQELDLSATLRGSVEAIMPTAVAKGVELFIGHCPPVFVTADPRRLEQILLNLLANAVKFTPRDGRVTITMNVHDSSVDVAIADTGIGIAPQFLPFVFERFRQGEQSTARTAGGLGLGLFIARQLAEAQNGTITARSAGPGSGSTFTVSFPVVAAPMPRRSAWKDGGAEPAIHAETTRHSLTGVRVLLVDDDADIRELMVATLEAADADVTAAGSADEALDVLEQREVDVLLADIAMPERDGYDLIRAVRSTPSPRISRMPAAAVTACARDDERLRALSAGFQLHIPKPVDPEALVKAVVSLVSTANAGRA
jgi:CheY-like chemotaxis protein